jgi:hypothetical protein
LNQTTEAAVITKAEKVAMSEETPTARTIRLIQEEERERCAKIAEDLGKKYNERAMGGAIAAAIRQQ